MCKSGSFSFRRSTFTPVALPFALERLSVLPSCRGCHVPCYIYNIIYIHYCGFRLLLCENLWGRLKLPAGVASCCAQVHTVVLYTVIYMCVCVCVPVFSSASNHRLYFASFACPCPLSCFCFRLFLCLLATSSSSSSSCVVCSCYVQYM